MDRIANAAPVVASSPASQQLSPGSCVEGKYIICDVLGTGGSAVVYAAEQVGLRRVVAFKLYPVGGGVAPKLVKRFQREAELLARIHHENVVAVYDSGSMPDGSPYLVVQRLQGDSLATRLLAGPLPVNEAASLTRQVLSALSALGDAGIVHRDVKPDNLVLDAQRDGGVIVKLVDFGVAQEIHGDTSVVPRELVGTPHYMAPEQVRGDEVDARCDLYGLGATLYEMLTGRTPHAGETLHEVATATLFGEIAPVRALRPDCPEGLEQIVMKALAREPGERFASARAMKSALDHWEAQQQSALPKSQAPEEVAPDSTPLEDTLRIPTCQPNASPGRGKRRTLGFVLAACLAALVGLVLSGGSPAFDLREASNQRAGRAATKAAELLTRARRTTHELVEVGHDFAQKWTAERL